MIIYKSDSLPCLSDHAQTEKKQKLLQVNLYHNFGCEIIIMIIAS